MRTKTLILSAVAGFIGCAAALADTNVYSLNAVGYINVTCKPGFNMIANQLNTTNNSVKYLIVNSDDGTGTGGGIYDGVQLYKWTGSTYATDTGDLPLGDNGWAGGGTITMNPGEALWFKNPKSTNLVLTFVGEVMQGSLTNALPTGFNMRSSIVPQAGGLSSTLGLINQDDGSGNGTGKLDGDQVYVWTAGAGGGYTTSTADLALGDGSGWSNEPQLNVGQGMWYHAGAPRSWVRSFSANN